MLARDIHDEDTIELQLSPADLEWLTQAAEQAADSPPVANAAPVPERGVAGPAISATPVRGTAIPAVTIAEVAVAAEAAALESAAVPEVPGSQMATRQMAPVPKETYVPITAPVAETVAVPNAARTRSAVPTRAKVALVAPETATRVRRPSVALPATLAILAFAVALVLFYWPAKRAPERAVTPPAPVVTPTPKPRAPEPPAAEVATAEPPPVRFTNPFDPSEVFEFPAGTSYGEARNEVAQRLIDRAQERKGLMASQPKHAGRGSTTAATNDASLAQRL
ncbi:MAG: hypothetical protein WDO68_06600 [Gammaproteobacteria bacterium]